MCILTVLSILRLIPIQIPIIWLPAVYCETGSPVGFRMPPASNSRAQIEKKINAFYFSLVAIHHFLLIYNSMIILFSENL